MVTSEARIATDRPQRYLAQLCKHAAGMASGGHGARMHLADHQAVADVDVDAEWSDTRGVVTFSPWGSCTLTADETILTLRIQARDAEALRRIEGILTRDLDRFGRRDGLEVSWRPPHDPDA